MRFGQRVRELRQAQKLTLRALSARIGVGFTYLSKVENERLDFAEYPSEELIVRLATALDADPEELLFLAKKIPERIRKRVLERPDVFCTLADLDDVALDKLLAQAATDRRPPQRRST
jgi:transcriptional regulator with XRE-family HTH domain